MTEINEANTEKIHPNELEDLSQELVKLELNQKSIRETLKEIGNSIHDQIKHEKTLQKTAADM